ncbi:MAG: DUF3179 domain-containing protein [Gammaproteobacteria bacterium]
MPVKNPILIPGKYSRWLIYSSVLVLALITLSNKSFSLSSDNGFDLTEPLVPRDEIFHGGPPRDGIASIDNPKFVHAVSATFLKKDDRILGLIFNGVTRAYPIKILNYHEIVNDKIKAQSIVISYCPLCGSGMAFNPKQSNGDDRFGVSGLLYNNDMLLYDRATESLWSQIISTAISGKLKGQKLNNIPLINTSWFQWLQQHPDSEVLSTQTGYSRNYNNHPYGDYDTNRAIYFPIQNNTARFHPKQRVIGITLGADVKAYPLSELDKQAKAHFTDQFAGQTLTIDYDAKNQSVTISNHNGINLPVTNLFWFAWYAFHPNTRVFMAK